MESTMMTTAASVDEEINADDFDPSMLQSQVYNLREVKPSAVSRGKLHYFR